MAAASQRFDPVLADVLMVVHRCGQATPQLNGALIHQPAQTQHGSFFRTIETGLLSGQPADFVLGDHAGGQAFKNDLSNGHESDVTDLLHSGAPLLSPRFGIVLTQCGVGVMEAFDLRAARWFAHQILALADGIDGGAFRRGVDAAFEVHRVTPDVIEGAGYR